ncbi:hypothetical protein CVT24_007830 [Panaeolus cyanescens]|uniref:Beta-lactamase-related domain-containing protein n=1 Tax=Panaeolus cyanescens TaxID=181874 RepID=A0A409VZI4_9AGAR|nr:hypothetical protein CVT24_007830 [Panaeolus cyanescens]
MSPILTIEGRRALDDLTQQAAKRNIPGFIYGASSVEGELYFTSGGHRTVHDPTSGEVDPDTMLWICSMTKLVTHVAALQLVERGVLSVDTPVSEYFSEFEDPIVLDDFASHASTFTRSQTVIRVGHLMTYTSGLKYSERTFNGVARIDAPYTNTYRDDEDNVRTFFKLVKGPYPSLPLKFEPGTDFAYGWNSDVLGFIIEKVTGQTLEQFFQENIFQPLDMKASFYLTPELRANYMHLSRRAAADRQLEPWKGEILILEQDPEKVKNCRLGGVGLYTSPREYLKLLRHILQIYKGCAERPILKHETVQSMFRPSLSEKGAKSVELFTNRPHCQWSNACALCTADWAEGRKRGSVFWSGWAGTYFHIDPETSIAAVFGTQVYPTRDVEVLQTVAQFERVLYDGCIPPITLVTRKTKTSAMPVTLTKEGRRALDEVAGLAAEGTMPPFVYGATSIDEEIYFTSNGFKVFDDPTSGRVGPDTTFWVCSQTKMIGHLAALQLIERGHLNYNTPVSEFFPAFRNAIVINDITDRLSGFRPAKTQVTIKHLLNFSSGLAYPTEYFPREVQGFPLPEAYTFAYSTVEDAHERFFGFVKGIFPEIPLVFEPGTSYAYGWGSDILGFIVEKISGQSLEEYCQENIFKPLDIKATFRIKNESELVQMSYRRADGQLERLTDQVPIIERVKPEEMKIHLAGVGVYTSLRDYLKLLRHLLQIYAGTAINPIAKREAVLSMFEPALSQEGASALEMFLNHPHCQWSSALGVCSADWAEGRKRGSAFWLGWANTHYHMDPKTGIAAVYGTQINPFMDPEVTNTFARFERALYDGLA